MICMTLDFEYMLTVFKFIQYGLVKYVCLVHKNQKLYEKNRAHNICYLI